MKYDSKTRHYRFTQTEERWIIDTLIRIELTHPVTGAELSAINKIKHVMIVNEQDPLDFVWEPVYQMFKDYRISDIPDSITIRTDNHWYVGAGSGKYYPLHKKDKNGIVHYNKRKAGRQKVRNKSLESAEAKYKDVPMSGDDMLQKLIRDNQEFKVRQKNLEERIASLEEQLADKDDIAAKEEQKKESVVIDMKLKRKVSHKLQKIRDTLRERKRLGIAM